MPSSQAFRSPTGVSWKSRLAALSKDLGLQSIGAGMRFRDQNTSFSASYAERGPPIWYSGAMHERAKRIGGRLKIWSEPGAGTEAELTVPARIAYAKSARAPVGETGGKRQAVRRLLCGWPRTPRN
jgi:hypothetical protein